MKIETLNERIEKANEKITRKQGTIEKKTARIAKLSDMIRKEFGKDAETADRYDHDQSEAGMKFYWTMCDIEDLKDDIRRGEREIEETRKTIEKYKAQLAGEIEKERLFTTEIPESMKEMKAQLEKEWTAYDIERRERVRKAKSEMSYKEWWQKYGKTDYDLIYKTDEEIRKENDRDAEIMVLNLYNRIKAETGEVISWDNIFCNNGNLGPVLNGYVEGKEGRVRVESILAGGYNIQRLHVRVLTHKF